MTTKKTKEGRIGAQNKALILAAAEQEFALHGFKGTRIQQVADRAGLPKTNVLYYFKSKFGLYMALLEQTLTIWNSAFDTASAKDDPADVLARYITEKMAFSRSKPLASKIFALEVINGAENLQSFFEQKQVEWIQDRVNVIQSWIDQGKINTPDPYFLIFNIWACCQHYADFSSQVNRLLGEDMDEDKFSSATRAVIHLILTGCGLTVPENYQ